MLAIHENPPVAHPEGSIADVSATWWVAHTRSHHEKALAFHLLGWEIPYFLPMAEKTTIIRGRRFRVMMPLFPGYLFFAGDAEARYKALTTSHIANVIPVADQNRLVAELSQIQQALGSRVGLDPYPYLRKGAECVIRSGPLRGIRGVIVNRRGNVRLVLRVSMLGQAVSAEIDPSLVEPAD
jgi:transcription termination/antitermination protein NusG